MSATEPRLTTIRFWADEKGWEVEEMVVRAEPGTVKTYKEYRLYREIVPATRLSSPSFLTSYWQSLYRFRRMCAVLMRADNWTWNS